VVRITRRLSLVALIVLASAVVPASASAAVSLEPVGGTFTSPIQVVSSPGEGRRLFVVERDGVVRVVRDGVKLATPFLDLRSRVSTAGEGGLLSLAFAEDYVQTGRMYVFYTDAADNNRIDELRRSSNVDRAEPSSRRSVMVIPHTGSPTNHYGGTLQFRDGLLYASIGDGGNGLSANARRLDNLLGKIIRIDPRPGRCGSYGIPGANPFAGSPCGGGSEIWTYGLRNPFRFSFDRQTGALAIGDVGQNEWEEIDYVPRGEDAGLDFGWNVCEGNHAYPDVTSPCSLAAANYRPPIHEYASGAPCRSITGGYVVRDPSLPELAGRLLYADYCTGEVRGVNVPGGEIDDGVLSVAGFGPSSFGEDPCGRVYISELGAGRVSRFRDQTPGSCKITPVYPGGVTLQRDQRSPLLGLRTGPRQRPFRNDGVIVRVRCSEPCSYRVGGRLSLRRAGRRIALGQRTGSLAANTTARLRMRLSSPSARSLRRALGRGRVVRVRVEVRVRDRSGNLAKGSRLLRLID